MDLLVLLQFPSPLPSFGLYLDFELRGVPQKLSWIKINATFNYLSLNLNIISMESQVVLDLTIHLTTIRNYNHTEKSDLTTGPRTYGGCSFSKVT